MKKHPLKKLSLYILRNTLSGNGKRIVFLVTTYLQLTKGSTVEREDWVRLNKALHLARSEDALVFPTMLSGLVWNGKCLEDAVCKECELTGCEVLSRATAISISMRACRAIVDIAPPWLRYGRKEDMYRDLVALVSVGRENSLATA